MLDAHLSKSWISCSLSLLEPADPLTPPEADLTQIGGGGKSRKKSPRGRTGAGGSAEAGSMGCVTRLYTQRGCPVTGQQKEKVGLWSVLGVLFFLLKQESNFRGLSFK